MAERVRRKITLNSVNEATVRINRPGDRRERKVFNRAHFLPLFILLVYLQCALVIEEQFMFLLLIKYKYTYKTHLHESI